MEKCMHNHVSMITDKIICSEQYGFLKGKYCSTQQTYFHHEIGTYLDFSKAFESVSYRLFLHKLKRHGFNSQLLDWFTSYLTNRKQ